jgi:hypothetical protein
LCIALQRLMAAFLVVPGHDVAAPQLDDSSRPPSSTLRVRPRMADPLWADSLPDDSNPWEDASNLRPAPGAGPSDRAASRSLSPADELDRPSSPPTGPAPATPPRPPPIELNADAVKSPEGFGSFQIDGAILAVLLVDFNHAVRQALLPLLAIRSRSQRTNPPLFLHPRRRLR